jgi:outer membrane receptor protein involved in Fe transport
MRFWLAASAVVLILLSGGPAAAQVGSLTVVVFDGADGGPLPGATVTISNDRGLIAPTAELTDEDGRVEFPVLHSGPGYTIEVSAPGFADRRVAALRVRSGVTELLKLLMSPEIRERVEVSAQSNVVELDRTGNPSKFDYVFIENLPVPGRFYQNILSLAPGVQDADSDGNPNVHGARTRDFRAEVGGISNVDPLTGEWLSFINPSSIEEMEILGPGAGVEWGRAVGGFARIVQKQGSNDLEGTFSFIYRSSDLDGSGATTVSEDRLPEYEWIQPGLYISGAIVKDRLWYRLSHEYIQHEDPADFLTRVEVIRRTQTINDDQLTWQVSPRNKLSFQFRYDPYRHENYGLSANISPESTRTLERGGPTYMVTWTAPQSARLLFESKVAFQNHRTEILPTTSGGYNGCVGFRRFPALWRAHCLNADEAIFTGPYNERWQDNRQRLTLRSQATYYAGRLLGMTHRLKAGFVVENERFYRELDRDPFISFNSFPMPLQEDDAYAFVTVNVPVPRSTAGRATGINWALYAEDQFHPLNNLAVTLGLRFDHTEINSVGLANMDPRAEAEEFYKRLELGYPLFTATRAVFTAYDEIGAFYPQLAEVLGVGLNEVYPGTAASQSTFWDNTRRTEDIHIRNNDISPRLTVAWDPLGNGKMKLAFSAGRYYDKTFLAVPLLEVEPPNARLTILLDRQGAEPFNEQGQLPGFSPTVSVQMIDRGLRTPYQDEFSFSFERELWPETSIKLTYLSRKYRDQFQDIDVNHRLGDEGRCVIPFNWESDTVVPSDGHGQPLRDPYTDEIYYDTDPGPGDGIIDDCMGDIRRLTSALDSLKPVPDGLPDLYVLNPGWGELLLVGNFNATEYTAYMIELVRRRYRNWEMMASYTWSEAVGNAEDFDQLLGNERTLLEDEYGYLSHDQRHAFKLSAVSLTPWGLRIGGTARWESGLPFSELTSKLTAHTIPLDYSQGDPSISFRLRYPSGQRNDQRNPSYWTFDLRAAKEFQIARVNAQLTAEVFNLLNDDTIKIEQRLNTVSNIVRRNGRRYQVGFRLSF